VDCKKYNKTRDELYEEFKKHNIYVRRYFYPLISQFSIYSGLSSSRKGNLPIAENITNCVICLPIFPDLSTKQIHKICNIIKENA
jgi:dTDP-4-amino-4,6-dideoxygalactose transaminase